MARPTDLTPELQEKIVAIVRKGNFRVVAAEACGIGESTLSEWIARGEGRDKDRPQTPEYAAFAAAIKAAEAEAEIAAMAVIESAGLETWQAAAWYLERKFPGRWGKREKHELSGPNDGPIQTTGVVILPPEGSE